jgi:hypothetical protein
LSPLNNLRVFWWINMTVFKEGSGSFAAAVSLVVIGCVLTAVLGFLISNSNSQKDELQEHDRSITAMKVTELAQASQLSDLRRQTEDKITSIEQTQVTISASLEALKESSIASNTTQTAELASIKNQLLDVRKDLGPVLDFIRPIRTSPSGH